MTLLVVSDQHLGAGASLGDRLADQRSSWERVCVTAAELGATVIHAGDAFRARRPGMAEMDAFQTGLEILREGGCTLVGIAGNHDVADGATPTAFEVACSGYDAHVFREPQVIDTPEGGVALLPWMPPTMDARRTAEALMIVAEDLAEQGARILVAHWALAGGSLPNGLPLLDLAEPMLDPHALAASFELTLAGHIHKRQVIVDTPSSFVAHTGPLSRCGFGEASVETCAWQVVCDASSHVYGWPIEIPDRRFLTVESDVRESGYPTEQILDDVMDADVAGAIVRVSWQQRADQQVDQAVIFAALAEYEAHHVDRLEAVIERAQSTRSAGVTETADPRVSWDAWQDAQPDLAAEDTLAAARESAHERIGGAA